MSVLDALYTSIDMRRIMLTLSENEFQTLRQLSFERDLPVTRLVREAIDGAYGTRDDIRPPGRPAQTEQQS